MYDILRLLKFALYTERYQKRMKFKKKVRTSFLATLLSDFGQIIRIDLAKVSCTANLTIFTQIVVICFSRLEKLFSEEINLPSKYRLHATPIYKVAG